MERAGFSEKILSFYQNTGSYNPEGPQCHRYTSVYRALVGNVAAIAPKIIIYCFHSMHKFDALFYRNISSKILIRQDFRLPFYIPAVT
jgi:hypothetical protein